MADSQTAELLAAAASRLLGRGRLELAREVAGEALAEDPDCANAHSVLHVVCDELGQWPEGLAHARRAVELLPGSAQLRYNLALSTLRLDDYRTGFELMEARFDKPDWTGLATPPAALPSATECCGPANRWMENGCWWSPSRDTASSGPIELSF